ncbi:MAG: hypothetical protein MJA27_26830 [Pseudanabaenales cyanobacterium]|nr:hypothetical protein [Pseudanabaenales cyanobacterium]
MLKSLTTNLSISPVNLQWQMSQTSRGTLVKIWEPKSGEQKYCWKQSATFESHSEARVFLLETAKANEALLEEIK